MYILCTCIDVYMYVGSHAWAYICVCWYIDTHITGMYLYMHVAIYVCMHACMYVLQGCGQTPRSNVCAQGSSLQTTEKISSEAFLDNLFSKSDLQKMFIKFTP